MHTWSFTQEFTQEYTENKCTNTLKHHRTKKHRGKKRVHSHQQETVDDQEILYPSNMKAKIQKEKTAGRRKRGLYIGQHYTRNDLQVIKLQTNREGRGDGTADMVGGES